MDGRSPASVDHSEVECCVTVETLADSGSVTKARQYKSVTLYSCRNEFRDVVLRMQYAKSGMQTFVLSELVVRGKFVKAGKASLKVNRTTQLLVCNCAPSKLTSFLRCLSVKFACWKRLPQLSGRQRLLSAAPRTITEISPLNAADMKTACVIQRDRENRENNTTPKGKSAAGSFSRGRKRPLTETDPNVPQTQISTQVAEKRLKKVLSTTSSAALTAEQKKVLQTVLAGRSIFFTGSAGTGKSFLLKRIVGSLPPDTTYVTASTGVAACAVGGTTLHAFAGIGTGQAPLSQCTQLASRPHAAKQWKKCRTLVIDEISMVDADFFDKMEAVARYVTRCEKPFGGIQLVVCGDFLQLPPVWRDDKQGAENRKPSGFCFQASAWSRCIEVNMELTDVKRQTDDLFIDILQKVRLGRCTDDVVSVLSSTRSHQLDRGEVLATRLCTHREDVAVINHSQLARLPGLKRTFQATDSDESISKSRSLSSLFPVAKSITLAVGAQVMLCKNVDVGRGLVNGARGVVTAFSAEDDGLPVVRFLCGVTEVFRPARWTVRAAGDLYLTRRQLPLSLAWAISIHKSQGMSLDCVEMSLSRVFEAGQAYVALSRARTLAGLKVLDFEPGCIRANKHVLAFYRSLQLDHS